MDRPVAVVEEARRVREIAQLDAFMAFPRPVDLGHRTGPGLGGERIANALQETPVKAGIVGDHQGCGRGESRDLGRIDTLAGDHRVIDSCERRDFRRDRIGGLTQPIEGFSDRIDLSVEPIGKRCHRQFDNFITDRIEPGCLHINEQPKPGRRAIGRRGPPGL